VEQLANTDVAVSHVPSSPITAIEATRAYGKPERQETFTNLKKIGTEGQSLIETRLEVEGILSDSHVEEMNSPQVKVEEILLHKLKRDARLRDIDLKAVEAFVEAMEAGDCFPPVVVFYDGEYYWLADGFHRIEAAESKFPLDSFDKNMERTFPAEIRDGTLDDAKWYSYGANKTNALYRSNDAKRRAVRQALRHPRASGMSNVDIANHVGVSEGLVRKIKVELVQEGSLSSELTKIRAVTRKGTVYPMDVRRIGKNKTATFAQKLAPGDIQYRLSEACAIVIKVLRGIERDIVLEDCNPAMLDSQVLRDVEEVRDGFNKLLRWNTRPPELIERDELTHTVIQRELDQQGIEGPTALAG